MSKFESVTNLVDAVQYADTRLGNCYAAVAVQAVTIDPAAVLADLYAAYFVPYMAAKEQGNKKLQSAVGRRWNIARTGTVKAMKENGYTVKFPSIKKGGTVEILENSAAAAAAATAKEQQKKDDEAAMSAAAAAADQQRAEAIKGLTLEALTDELEQLIALSDHTPESVVAELVNRLTATDQTARIWAVAA